MKRIFLCALLISCGPSKITAPPTTVQRTTAEIDSLLVQVNWRLIDCQRLRIKCLIVSVQLSDTLPQHLWRAP